LSDSDWRPNLFEYVDYRRYMAAYYEAAKPNVTAMSFRYLARRAGFSSPNFYKLVMEGDRNLSDRGAARVAKALELDSDERAFFLLLVKFDQATEPAERTRAFEQIAASQRFRSARRIDADLFEYLSRWYYPAIREMAARSDFVDDPHWIAGRLFPPITPDQARRALELLLELELLVRDEDGRFRRNDAALTTGHEVRSLAVAAYHQQMIGLAAESIGRFPVRWRDVSAQTFCVGATTVAELKDRVHQFRESLVELVESDDEPRLVYQLNIQLFPLSRVEEEDP